MIISQKPCQRTIQHNQFPLQRARLGTLRRQTWRLSLAILLCHLAVVATPPCARSVTPAYAQPLATVQIRYYMPQASEVFLVWGINDWDTVPVQLRPPGTVLMEKALHTPMNREDNAFVIELQVPAGAMINYGFLITRAYTGQDVKEWETSHGGGLQAIATDGLVIEARTKKKLELVSQEIQYSMPEAGEVFLVWGVNGWKVVPDEQRPEGTEIRNSVMHTPMARDGDAFLAQVQVFAGTTINYGFLTTKSGNGESVRVWDSNKDYNSVASQESGTIEIDSDLTQAADPLSATTAGAPLVTEEIRHQFPEASEVFLVWGINGWGLVAEEQQPDGTKIKNGVMHTPMDREGDAFVAIVQVPAGTTIDYGFLITETRDEETVHIWESDEDYHTVAREGNSVVKDDSEKLEGEGEQTGPTAVPANSTIEIEDAPPLSEGLGGSNSTRIGLGLLLFGTSTLLVLGVMAVVVHRKRLQNKR